MHKGSLPQADDRPNSGQKTFYAGNSADVWKVLWRGSGQKHWSARLGIIGRPAAIRFLEWLEEQGYEAYRYRI